MRKDASITTSISLQLVDDSIIIKDATGKTRIASADDDKKIAKIIKDIAKDTSLPDLDIHNIHVGDNGATDSGGGGLDDLDLTDIDSIKKAGLGYLLNHLRGAGNFNRSSKKK